MRKNILLTTLFSISIAAFGQSFQCPDITLRNNGNNVNCAGDAGNPINSSIPSSFPIPTSSKQGRATLTFQSKLTDAPVISAAVNSSGQSLDVEFGPPSEWVATSKSTYELQYCFYKNNLPAQGFYQITFKNNSTGGVYGKCSYDGQTTLTPPTIVTQPASKLNICKGSNYTFSCSATAAGNNTTLSYQWKKNGSNISGETSSSLTLSNVTNANNGDYTVVVTETYTNGGSVPNESSVATFLVDAVKPTALAKNITINLNSSGSATIATTDINNSSTDNCTIKSYSLSKTIFDCSNVGNNTVTLTVTDDNDNVSTANAVVTVKDVTAPVAKEKNFTLNLNANGQATLLSSDINDGSSDACGIATYTLSKENFNDKNVGDNTVTMTVTDKNGNSSSANATVTVKDVTAPEAKAK
ncbi:MAG: immunoglobulin domain-containing protein, partial [Bacteroidota bacterium]